MTSVSHDEVNCMTIIKYIDAQEYYLSILVFEPHPLEHLILTLDNSHGLNTQLQSILTQYIKIHVPICKCLMFANHEEW